METLEISNSTLDDIRGFSGNTSLTTLTLNHCIVGRFSQTTFANTGKSGQFNVNLNQSTITTLEGFTNSNIINLDINNTTINTISANAFSNLTSLNTVVVRGTSRIETIGENAFINCTRLTTLNIDNSSTVSNINDNAFKFCDLSTTFNLTNNVSTMGSDVFNSTKITTAIIPRNLTTLGTGVYSTCRDVTNVDFRGNTRITSIPGWTFYENVNLRNITIPSSVNTIGESAFKIEQCKDNNNDGISSINLSNISTLGEACFKNSAISSYSTNNNVRRIPASAFENCSMMTNLQLYNHNNPLEIGDNAFKNTKRITNMDTQMDSVTTVGTSAFEESGIHARENYYVEHQIRSIGNRAFYQCKRLEWFPFYSKAGYSNYSARIGEDAFAYTNLTKIGNETSNTSGGTNGGTNKIDENFSDIGLGAFRYSGIRWINKDSFNANIIDIPSKCFQGIGNSEYPTNGSAVFIDNWKLPWTNIGSYAFEDAGKIENESEPYNINLYKNGRDEINVTSIGAYAFANIKKCIGNINIGAVHRIDNFAFFNSDIIELEYEGKYYAVNTLSIGDWAFGHSEEWNNSLANNIRNKGSTCNLGPIINYARTIGEGSFHNLAGISNIESNVPIRTIIVWNGDRYDNLINVGDNAFEYNIIKRNPKSRANKFSIFPNKLQSVGIKSFRRTCFAPMTSFISPFLNENEEFSRSSSITTIGDYAFQYNSLTSYSSREINFWLPSTLSNIGELAFSPIVKNVYVSLSPHKKYYARNGNTGLAYNFFVIDVKLNDGIRLNFNNSIFENNESGYKLVENIKKHFNNNFTPGYTFS